MSSSYRKGNPFAMDAACLVHPVDLSGRLAGGVGLAFARHFPAIVEPYAEACRSGALSSGTVQLLRLERDLAIANLPVRDEAERPLPAERIEAAFGALAAALAGSGLGSLAVPHLDLAPEGPSWAELREIAERQLAPLAAAGMDVILLGESAREERALAEHAAGDRPVREFQGTNRFFSNMFRVPVAWGDEVTPARLWPLNELPYVLAKTLSPKLREDGIAVYRRAESAKPGAGGSAIKNWGGALELRADWDRVKDAVMLALVRDKFARNAELKAQLLATGNGLIEEGNNWGDIYWGVALKDKPGRGIVAGQGQNRLGRIMMQVRDELRRGECHLALAFEAEAAAEPLP